MPFALDTFLPELDAAGIKGSHPRSSDIMFLLDYACRLSMTKHWNVEGCADVWHRSTLEEIVGQVATKNILRDLAEFVQGFATTLESNMLAVEPDANLYGNTPRLQLVSEYQYSDYFLRGFDLRRISDPSLVKDSIEDGDSIRALYQDFSNMSRFIFTLNHRGTMSSVINSSGKRDDYRYSRADYAFLGPYIWDSGTFNPARYLINEGNTVTETTEFASGVCAAIEWNNGTRSFARYLSSDGDDDLNIVLNTTSTSSVMHLEKWHRAATKANLVIVYRIRLANWLNQQLNRADYPDYLVAVPYSCRPYSNGGRHWTLSPIDFRATALALLAQYESRHPGFHSKGWARFEISASGFYFDTGKLNNPLGLPDGWKFERN